MQNTLGKKKLLFSNKRKTNITKVKVCDIKLRKVYYLRIDYKGISNGCGGCGMKDPHISRGKISTSIVKLVQSTYIGSSLRLILIHKLKPYFKV